MEGILSYDKFFSEAAKHFKSFKGLLYMGRGISFPLAVMRAALEGPLSFKEAYDLTGLRGGAFQEYGRRLGVPLQ